MSEFKKEFSSPDAALAALYAKRDAASAKVYPLIVNGDGAIQIGQGLNIPPYDEIEIGYTGSNINLIVYKLASVSVATITLAYTDNNLTSVVKS